MTSDSKKTDPEMPGPIPHPLSDGWATYRSHMPHELWVDPVGLQPICLAGPMGDAARALLPEVSILDWTFEAQSHFEAMTKYHARMGWPPFVSDDRRERGIDLLSPVWHLLDLTPGGRADWYPSLSYP